MFKKHSSRNAGQQGRFGGSKTNRSGGSNNKSYKKESTLHNSHFEKKAEHVEEEAYEPILAIAQMPVDARIIENLAKKGYTHATEIQEKTLTPMLEGRNVMGLAQTGTGKTAAFLVPLVHQMLQQKSANQVLIIAPTRELALQIEKELCSITTKMPVYSQVFIGGTSVHRDLQKLKRASHFIIGTPGRLNDMVNQGGLSFAGVQTLVLDEFDRLLDMGFSKDILMMAHAMKNRRQTILFSATEEANQQKLIGEIMDNPVRVRTRGSNSTASRIDQEIIKVKAGEDKMDVLAKLIQHPDFSKVIIFAETKRWVTKVYEELKRRGIKTDEIHGDKSQNYRQKALQSLKNHHIQVLVATDVAARGIDIDEISHVINYQKPRNLDSYIHRIGRTGRAGKSGKAYTFIN